MIKKLLNTKNIKTLKAKKFRRTLTGIRKTIHTFFPMV